MRGLYIHIPFCVKKCSYCDFYSLPGRTDTIASYIQAVLKEAESYADCHSEPFHRRTLNLASKRDSNFPSFVKRTHPSTGRIEGDLFPQLTPSQSPFTKRRSPNVSFQTLYLGGGTPSLLGPKNFTTLITGLNLMPLATCGCRPQPEVPEAQRERDLERGVMETPSPWPSPIERERELSLLVSPLAPCGRELERGVSLLEATIEVNPESATPEFLQTVKNLGFTRLSFGVQSLDDNELKSVGRIHTAKQALAAIKLAQKLNFPAISADLIIGLPGQTSASLHQSLETLVNMGIQHLSVYCLSLETGTPLANNPPPDLPTDDLQADLFEKTRNYLITCGFAHYEISNFARPGYECLHNLNYWRGGEYLGLGPAAASHLNGKRFKNRANLDAYLQNPTAQIEDVEELSAKDKAAEEAMLRLRLLEEGLDAQVLTERFGQENAHDVFTRLDKMVQEGLLIREGSRYRLESSRIMTSNPIFARVLKDDD